MGSLMKSKIKYVAYAKGKPWYHRRYPTDILGHPQLEGKSFLRQRIKVSPDDPVAFIAELDKLNSAFDSFVSTLRSANKDILQKHELTKKALDYLRLKQIPVGFLDYPDERFKSEAVEGVMDEHFWEMQVHAWEEREARHELPPSELVQIQEEAWRLITTPSPQVFAQRTYSQIFEQFWNDKKLSVDSKRHKEHKRIRSEFLDLVGGDRLVDTDTLKSDLIKYLAKLRKRGNISNHKGKILEASTLDRYLSVVLTPIKYHNEYAESELEIIKIQRPSIEHKKKATNRKPPITHDQQYELINAFSEETAWRELYIILSLQTGLHPSEAVQLKRDKFNFLNTIPLVSISGENTQRKTEARRRLVPLVYKVDRIQELLEQGALEELCAKSTDNISAQLNKVLKRLNPNWSCYSLRHTLRHNLQAAAIPTDLQAEIGGWEAKGSNISESQAGYGVLGKDSNERIAVRAKALKAAMAHLMLPEDNIIQFKQK